MSLLWRIHLLKVKIAEHHLIVSAKTPHPHLFKNQDFRSDKAISRALCCLNINLILIFISLSSDAQSAQESVVQEPKADNSPDTAEMPSTEPEDTALESTTSQQSSVPESPQPCDNGAAK